MVLAGVYAVLTAAGGVVTGYGDRAEDRLGVGGTVVGAYGTAAACMVVPLVAPALALPAMVGFLTLPSLAGPAKSNYLNERTDSVARATTLSAVSFVNSLVRIPVLLAGGVVADAFSPTLAMAAVGAAVLGVGGGVVLVDRPLTTPVTARGATAD